MEDKNPIIAIVILSIVTVCVYLQKTKEMPISSTSASTSDWIEDDPGWDSPKISEPEEPKIEPEPKPEAEPPKREQPPRRRPRGG